MNTPHQHTMMTIAADLDGTLSESKTPLRPEIAEAIAKWLSTNRFVIISGGIYDQFVHQVLMQLPPTANLNNLYLFPTNGAACYRFENGEWVKVYEETLSDQEQHLITHAIQEAVEKSGITADMTYGPQIESRGGQVTFSALGQLAPLEKKIVWDPDRSKRLRIVSPLTPLLPNFKISVGGTTSIDITRKGVDKAYAIEKMKKLLNVDNEHVIFFGDSIFENGNDWAATKTGVTCVKVINPADTLEKLQVLQQTLQ